MTADYAPQRNIFKAGVRKVFNPINSHLETLTPRVNADLLKDKKCLGS
jgi:hypothetical protein